MACCKVCCGCQDCVEGESPGERNSKCCCGENCCQEDEYCCPGGCQIDPCDGCEGSCDENTPCADELLCKCCNGECVPISICCGDCAGPEYCPEGCYCCESGQCSDEPCCTQDSDCDSCECCVDGYCSEPDSVSPTVVSVSYSACGRTVTTDGSFAVDSEPFCIYGGNEQYICFGATQALELYETVSCGGSQSTDLGNEPGVPARHVRFIYRFSTGACVGGSTACRHLWYGYIDVNLCEPSGGTLTVVGPGGLLDFDCAVSEPVPGDEDCPCYDLIGTTTITISVAP